MAATKEKGINYEILSFSKGSILTKYTKIKKLIRSRIQELTHLLATATMTQNQYNFINEEIKYLKTLIEE